MKPPNRKGRPRLSRDEKRDRKVLLSLTAAEYARLKRLAIDDDTSMAALARRWVLERLGRVPR